MEKGIKLAFAIVTSLIMLPIGFPIFAWRIHKNPSGFFFSNNKAAKKLADGFSKLSKDESGSNITPKAA